MANNNDSKTKTFLSESERLDNYISKLSGKIIESLESGKIPWRPEDDRFKEGMRGYNPHLPYNPTTGNLYKGNNMLGLMVEGRDDPRWMTFKQAQEKGAQVRRGEKGTQIQFFTHSKMVVEKDEEGKPILDEDGKKQYKAITLGRPVSVVHTVFNAEQIDGLPPLDKQVEKPTFDPLEQQARLDKVFENSSVRIEEKEAGKAYYSPKQDLIVTPPVSYFKSAEAHMGTKLHEYAHSTGHESRLDRDLKHPFGSEGYAREELVAEMSSLFLSAEFGVFNDLNDHPKSHTQYIHNWITILQDDPAAIIEATRAAEKVVQFTLERERTPEIEIEQSQSNSYNDQDQASIETGQVISSDIELAVPFSEKDEAKALGAKFNFTKKLWYAPAGLDQDQADALANRWGIEIDNVQSQEDPPNAPSVEKNDESQGQAISGTGAQKIDLEATFQSAVDELPELKYLAERFDINGVKPGTQLAPYGCQYDQEKETWYIPPGATDFAVNENLKLWVKVHDWAKDITFSDNLFISAQEMAAIETNAELESPTSKSTTLADRVDIAVPFSEKDEAKALGARWDSAEKTWYAPAGLNQDQADQLIERFSEQKENAPMKDTTRVWDHSNAEDNFRAACEAEGLIIPTRIIAGQRQRVDAISAADGQVKKNAGSYIFFDDNRPSGSITNFAGASGEPIRWTNNGVPVQSQEQRIEQQKAYQEKIEQRDQARENQYAEKAKDAERILGYCKEATNDFSYLQRKGVEAHAGVKFNERYNNLVIPMHSIETGELTSFQTIKEDGRKSSFKGGRMKGSGFLIGNEPAAGEPILIAEGYATGASLHEATGLSTLVAFGEMNMAVLAEAKAETNPVIVCGDLQEQGGELVPSYRTEKAVQEMQAKSLQVSVTSPPGDLLKGGKGSDFNDLAQTPGGKDLIKANVLALARVAKDRYQLADQKDIQKGSQIDKAKENKREKEHEGLER